MQLFRKRFTTFVAGGAKQWNFYGPQGFGQYWPVPLGFFAEVTIMEFVQQAAIRSVGGYHRRIVLGYAAFAIVALATVYFASGGPGFSETELAIATVLP